METVGLHPPSKKALADGGDVVGDDVIEELAEARAFGLLRMQLLLFCLLQDWLCKTLCR